MLYNLTYNGEVFLITVWDIRLRIVVTVRVRVELRIGTLVRLGMFDVVRCVK